MEYTYKENSDIWSLILHMLLNELQQATVEEDDDNTSAGFVDEQLVNTENPMPPLTTATEVEIEEVVDDQARPLSIREARELQENNDDDYDPAVENEVGSNDDEEEQVVPATVVGQKGTSDEIDKTLIPDDWHFPGFLAFVAWGPFCDPADRLKTVLITRGCTMFLFVSSSPYFFCY